MTNNSKVPNRLISEKSPYLLQHAYNSVDWWPWGDAAFQKAREEEKPIFLSIGYSTCHWCHVMERESFEDADVAALLNGSFVPVKVDREERPDVDAVYMQVCQALTGQGGWPLTAFLTPEGHPFFAGTYFPKTARYGKAGMMELLPAVAQLWETDRDKLLQQGARLTAQLRQAAPGEKGQMERAICSTAFDMYAGSFDRRWGGFGRAPKFPAAHNLMFLLRHAVLEPSDRALSMAEETLRAMYRGGLFDHVGGGFSRYSIDDKWLVPHFEKMLYDNALLAIAYLEAFRLTGDNLYRRVAEKTLAYVLAEMTDDEGGFYSAQDADSDGREGLYYVLTPRETIKVLGSEDGAYFNDYFGITDGGNFEGASIPNLLAHPDPYRPDDRVETLLPKLRDYRKGRVNLFRDEKILTAWNGLMIAAFAKAYEILGDPAYKTAAERAASFVKTRLTRPDGRLFVRYRDGEAIGHGYLDDYANMAWATLALYEATLDAAHLESALSYAESMNALFEDSGEGGYFLYAADGEQLVLRPKETYDGAVPSGNSVAAYVCARLSALTAEPRWEARADRQLRFLAPAVRGYPPGHSFALMAAQAALYPSKEIVCTAASGDAAQKLRRALASVFAPNAVILFKTADNEARINALAPFAASYPVGGGQTLYYLCENKACAAPFTGAEELAGRLKADIAGGVPARPL